jgi:hypothetical protein
MDPFVGPTESAAMLNMLAPLKEAGIDIAGKNIGFANATSDKHGVGLLGLIAPPHYYSHGRCDRECRQEGTLANDAARPVASKAAT